MSSNDDDDDDSGGGGSLWDVYRGILGGYIGGCHGGSTPNPMSNAGRYLAQLKRADASCDGWFASNKDASEELICALKRAAIKSRSA